METSTTERDANEPEPAVPGVSEKTEPALDAKTEPAETSFLKGRFVSESGKPISNVSILVSGEFRSENPPGSIVSHKFVYGNESGSFSVPIAKREAVVFLLRHKDFAFKRLAVKKPDDRRDDILLGDIVMKRGFRPTIQVLSQDGKPVGDVWVSLHMAVSQGELDSKTKIPSSPVDSECVLTDTKGKAVFSPVEAGNYFASVVETPHGWPHNREKDFQSKTLAKPIKGVYETAAIQLSPTAQTATIQAKKSINITVHFSDDKTDPTRESLHIEGGEVGFHVVDAYLSLSSPYPGNYQGDGRFLFEIPAKLRGAKLVLKQEYLSALKIENEFSYRCFVDGKEIIPPGYPLLFPLPDLDTDKTVEITCFKSPKITLHVVGEKGEPVKKYLAAAQYAKRGQTITFDQDETKVTSRGYMRWGSMNHQRLWASVSTEHGSSLGMDVEFSWRNFGKDTSKVNHEGFLPDEELRLYVIGKGYDVFEQKISKMKEGEEKNLTMVLKKLP